MATYKVLQDIEAEDKIVGPLTLWQFIYALGAGLMLYLSAIAVMKHALVFLIFTIPVALFVAFLAVPWGGDQPTEVWAIAKLRFFLKPRKRIWDQSGVLELVTITVPKQIERQLTDGLDQRQVRSRLSTLATTLDSRGWAAKNVNINLSAQRTTAYVSSDRLVDVSNRTMEVPTVDIRAEDDILDERANPVAQNLGVMINDAAAKYREALLSRMNQASSPESQAQPGAVPGQVSATAWFTGQQVSATAQTTLDTTLPAPPAYTVPQAAVPTAEEEALLARVHEQQKQVSPGSHLKTIETPEQLEADAKQAAALAAERQIAAAAEKAARLAEEEARKREEAEVLSEKQAAIMNLARRNDLSIATLQRQASKNDDGEVEISLH